MATKYAARLDIDYPKKMDRLTTFFRLFMVLPILLILVLVTTSTGGGSSDSWQRTAFSEEAQDLTEEEEEGSEIITEATSDNWKMGVGISGGLFAATALMIVFRQVYPRWWFDFAVELHRFSTRVGAYVLLLTDKYPSTIDRQSVHLDFDYPNVKKDLNQWMPLFKWLLAIPHYILLAFLAIGMLFVTIIAWFAILFTSKYPKGLFDYVVGVQRWGVRVGAYAFLLLTDEYPPFSLR